MTIRTFYCIVFIALAGYGCRISQLRSSKPLPTAAAITEEGFLSCFSPNTVVAGNLLWCEVSAVLYDGKKLLFANDKDAPADQSPVFSRSLVQIADTSRPAYLMAPQYAAAHKYEDFARTPDGRFVFLTTAFDRVKPGTTDWDGYNTILYWRTGDEAHPHVLATDDAATSSVGLRQHLAKVLANDAFPGSMPYFKIEGLAATKTTLFFGVREEGKTYSDFTHRAKIIGVSYRVEKKGGQERIRLDNDWRLIADFNPARTHPELPSPLALSSLEYDPYRRCFWMLTSLEANGQLDAYLWVISPENLYTNKPFTLITNVVGQPLHLGHKAEDLTPLDQNRLLLIHDDDRVQTTVGKRSRQSNQAAYSILTIK
ncbi:hypothetical protein [Spirosoma sp. KUDC1026]|uniref:hypothetical protein n=1 Tax=Spirosoma sp. KUDC1026 TaxID=2745947 RepID=UPI00159B9FC6|nr:hypothetical protein [Spirosoma sp. KUDC1026]QKZ14647.1 hypothetical protein HU175_19255 [Spirosoma sp. KUDC1026]